jgi:hypothetical protein
VFRKDLLFLDRGNTALKYRLAAGGLLLIMLWLELSTLSITAATPDEPMHILRGYVFVERGLDRVGSCVPCSPVLSGALMGLGLKLEPDLRLPPADDPGWADKTAFGFQEQFLWENSAPPLRMLFLARWPIVFVSLLLGALIFRWAAQRSGPLPALGALTLYVFCPNFLAHARLATTDVVAAATFVLSAYTFTRALDSTRRIAWVASGVALGLALAAKVSAVWLPVTFVILIVGRLWPLRRDRRSWLQPLGVLISTGVIGGLTLWGIYRFTIGPINPGGFPLPAPGYWWEWQSFNAYLKDPLPGYLLGEFSQFGWWYYFPIAFLAKTPLPVLIFLVLAVAHTVRARSWSRDLVLLLAPALLFASLLFSPHALGYRYLLPILPFIFVYSAEVIKVALKTRWSQLAVGLLIVWHIVGTLRYYPYYLTYFNEIVGGPDRGRYILIDSNLDWGQDLASLKQYVDEQQIDRIKFSYAGATPPSVYGLTTEALPPVYPAMRDQGAWWLHTFYPADPPPGRYAISVNPLMGEPVNYVSFREQTPDAVIGNSIYVYTVPARGTPVDVSLSGLQVDQIDAGTFRQFGTNDVRLRWFDAATSVIAAPDRSWVAITDQQTLAPELSALFVDVDPVTRTQTNDGQAYRLYHFDLGANLQAAALQAEQAAAWSEQLYPASEASHALSLPAQFGDTADLIGYTLTPADAGLTLVTYWRAGSQVTKPLQLFAHAIGPDGTIVAQEDRLDAPAFGWRTGDLIAQVNHLPLLDRSPQLLWIEVGLYNSASGERVPVTVADRPVDSRLLLQQVEVR